MTQIKALFIDMDNTLTDDSGSLRLSFEQTFPLIRSRYPHLEWEQSYELFRKINSWHWENYDQSPIASMTHSQDVRALIADEFLQASGHPDPAFARDIALQFQKARCQTYTCFPDTIPFLEELQGKIPRVLITNGNAEMQREKIKICQLEPVLDAIFVAQEVGFSKPSPEIFQQALETVHVDASETLMVGDNASKDIQGAQAAGLITAWIRRGNREIHHPDIQPDYTVRSLLEVKAILEDHDTHKTP